MTKLIVTFHSHANAPKMFLSHAEMYISALFLFWDNTVGIATRYGMDGPGIESLRPPGSKAGTLICSSFAWTRKVTKEERATRQVRGR
jgi:hypothetical protein